MTRPFFMSGSGATSSQTGQPAKGYQQQQTVQRHRHRCGWRGRGRAWRRCDAGSADLHIINHRTPAIPCAVQAGEAQGRICPGCSELKFSSENHATWWGFSSEYLISRAPDHSAAMAASFSDACKNACARFFSSGASGASAASRVALIRSA